ncbi:VOC family protein [Corallococcus sp. H22C18031201]|uniref:VOC family protein n=1 Tax=Citreicoccus inhibens TaxID=2849499 RepID=UPI000E72D40E|nr:VOC family protein [Citreicoccus inhibens]MBU8898991.1 VOC family protein [Citreicoccus inhibens]RJS18433.1 VOC family protein [Corallococcus sp. H22C18031201]
MPAVETYPAGTVSWVDLMTPNMEKSRAFYSALFGWTFTSSDKEKGGYSTCQRNGRSVAGMMPTPPNMGAAACWSLYFNVADIQASAERVRANGGRVEIPPKDTGGEGLFAVCVDPTGAYFCLWQALKHVGSGLVNEPGAMTWHELHTREAARARDFYVAVFGHEARKLDGMEFWTLRAGEATAAGIFQSNAPTPSNWQTYFAVADVDEATKTVTRMGGRVLMSGINSPFGRVAVVSDDAGATFAIIQLSPR